MITFQMFLIVLFSLIFLIIVSRFLSKNKFYLTSYYEINKEYNSNEVILKQNIFKALEMSNFKNIKENKNYFKSITLPSIFSFSEVIKAEVKKTNEDKYIVNFRSKCFFPLQIFDWGKNERNSNRFFKNLEASLQ